MNKKNFELEGAFERKLFSDVLAWHSSLIHLHYFTCSFQDNFLKSTAQHDLKSRPYPRVYGYMTLFLLSNEHYDINWLNYLAKPTQSIVFFFWCKILVLFSKKKCILCSKCVLKNMMGQSTSGNSTAMFRILLGLHGRHSALKMEKYYYNWIISQTVDFCLWGKQCDSSSNCTFFRILETLRVLWHNWDASGCCCPSWSFIIG